MTVINDPVKHTAMKVDDNQRAEVQAVQDTVQDHSANSGWKFNINTGDITITNATELPMLYVKNTGTYDLVINALIYNLGNSTNGTGDVKINVLRNPTAGGIITNTNDVDVGPGNSANQNFGSTNIMTGLFYKGAQGEAVLSGGDGITISTRSSSNSGRIFLNLGALVLPLGSSIGVNYTPPASNSSQIVQFAMACHIRHPSVVA